MRTAILFLLGIAAPCAVMGWLSWRAMGEEDAVIQRQRVALYQQVAERAAREAGEAVEREWRVFAAVVEKLAGEDGTGERLHFAMPGQLHHQLAMKQVRSQIFLVGPQ